MSDGTTVRRTVYFTMVNHPLKGWVRVGNAYSSRKTAQGWLGFVRGGVSPAAPTWIRAEVEGFTRWLRRGVGQVTANATGLIVQLFGKVWRVVDDEHDVERVLVVCFTKLSLDEYRDVLAVLREAWRVVTARRAVAA